MHKNSKTFLLIVSLLFVFLSNSSYAKNNSYTFSCPKESTIQFDNGTWTGRYIVIHNGVKSKMPPVSKHDNPNSQPTKLTEVDFYPGKDPYSEINCFYTTKSNKNGDLTSFPYALPENLHCHFKGKVGYAPSTCRGSIDKCLVVCD